MSPGQTGHITGQMGRVPGTDGTHTRGCPAKILYVYWFFFCDCSDQLQGVPGLPGPKCQKSLKKVVPSLSARSAKKVPKKLKKCRKKSLFGTFSGPFRLFRHFFWHSGPTGSGRPFLDFFGILGPEGLALPVTGRYNRKVFFFPHRQGGCRGWEGSQVRSSARTIGKLGFPRQPRYGLEQARC